MKKNLSSVTLTTGLAIFAMLFGAGNLIFPLKLGILAGDQTYIGLIAFLLSGVLLPVLGLTAMALFDGDIRAFFYRIGRIPGAAVIFTCMLIIGPLFVMPRIIALSYTLMQPFMPEVSRFVFALFFGILTFFAAYKKSSLVDVLGKILSPLKLASLFTIIGIGFYYYKPMVSVSTSAMQIFATNFKEGYNTLDLLGSLFFAYIIITVLKRNLDATTSKDNHKLAKIVLHGGIIGGLLLAVVYVGMGYLGAIHGQGLEGLAVDEMFIATLRRILGDKGAMFIAVTILVACLSTMIALATVVSEYLRTEIFNNKVSYTPILASVLMITAVMARYSLDNLLKFYGPIMDIIYPILIVLTFCNIAYKLFGFKPVKLPVLITFLVMTGWTGYDMLHQNTTKTETSEIIAL